ncbi:hypothetical protein OYQ23_005750, partial [Klebsiella variicola]
SYEPILVKHLSKVYIQSIPLLTTIGSRYKHQRQVPDVRYPPSGKGLLFKMKRSYLLADFPCAEGRLWPVSAHIQLRLSPPNNRNLITKSLIFFPAALTIVRALSLAQ